eukprot:NODE_1088_length_2256_cov_0.508577.p2 type:complete len:110 gc:universal NODE_1088_length_2256_cov_0.508577:1293-964(-)
MMYLSALTILAVPTSDQPTAFDAVASCMERYSKKMGCYNINLVKCEVKAYNTCFKAPVALKMTLKDVSTVSSCIEKSIKSRECNNSNCLSDVTYDCFLIVYNKEKTNPN